MLQNCQRIYLESRIYKKTKIKRVLYTFKNRRYISCIKSILLMEIYKILWNLTIVGGIIKTYSYRMVKYIVALSKGLKYWEKMAKAIHRAI